MELDGSPMTAAAAHYHLTYLSIKGTMPTVMSVLTSTRYLAVHGERVCAGRVAVIRDIYVYTIHLPNIYGPLSRPPASGRVEILLKNPPFREAARRRRLASALQRRSPINGPRPLRSSPHVACGF